MRTRLFVVSCIVGTILFVVFILTQPNVHAQNASVIPPKPLSLSQMKAIGSASNPGHPAVTSDNTSVNASANTASTVVAFPHIKSSDVKTYMFSHEFPSGPLATGATLKIVSIDLITSKAASVRLDGESIGLPDAALVYFVKVQGPFTTTMVPLAPGAKALPPVKFGIEVFDAEDGNLLIWSISKNGN